MNFLCHLYLAGADPELQVGGLMGDFVKGRLTGGYPVTIERGIALHRAIDSEAGRNGHFRSSRLRLDERFGLYRGVLVDLFYDHFLARDWERYHPQPLVAYLAEVRRAVQFHDRYLPERLRQLLPIIFEVWLPSYREPSGIEQALARMAGRLRRSNPLADGGAELVRQYEALQADFRQFLPEMTAFASRFQAAEQNR
jgi:acyl carrier protein phosphodiesterase